MRVIDLLSGDVGNFYWANNLFSQQVRRPKEREREPFFGQTSVAVAGGGYLCRRSLSFSATLFCSCASESSRSEEGESNFCRRILLCAPVCVWLCLCLRRAEEFTRFERTKTAPRDDNRSFARSPKRRHCCRATCCAAGVSLKR